MLRLHCVACSSDQGFAELLNRDLGWLGAHIANALPTDPSATWLDVLHEAAVDADGVFVIVTNPSLGTRWGQGAIDHLSSAPTPTKPPIVAFKRDDIELPKSLGAIPNFQHDEHYFHALGALTRSLGIDVDPLLIAREKQHFADVSDAPDARRARARVYNQIGMEILRYSGQFVAEKSSYFYPEGWRRNNEGATYAVDARDQQLYDNNMRELDRLNREYRDVEYLFSEQGLVLREAVLMFDKAARLGDSEAAWNLGWRYELGQGVPRNPVRARVLWAKAKASGHRAAAEKLADPSELLLNR